MEDLIFEIKIDFDKDAKNPQRIFKTLSCLIDEFDNIDKNLCKTISSKVEVDTMLEDVEQGSIKVFLRQVIKSIDDDGLGNCDIKKIFGKYLTDAKYLILNFLGDKDDSVEPNKLIQLQDDIFQLANKDENRILPIFNKVNTADLIKNIDGINKSLLGLSSKDKVSFSIEKKTLSVEYNNGFSIEAFEDVLTAKNLSTNNEMILKVKKPDYLGDSKWEFRHGKTSIPAKITDIDWLKKFQNREIDVRPKDAIKCMVNITTKYDADNEPLVVLYDIYKVIEIIDYPNFIQERIK